MKILGKLIMKVLGFFNLLIYICGKSSAFLPNDSSIRSSRSNTVSALKSSYRREGDDKFDDRSILNLNLVNAVVKPETALKEIFLVGKSEIVTSGSEKAPSLVFSESKIEPFESDEIPCLMVPVSSRGVKLLSFAVQNKKLSKSVLLTLNPLLTNRDGALFDNIPWSTWTIDPQRRNRDQTDNPIAPLYHLGKRDAFARFGGKDWKGRSVSIGNLALRLKYLIERNEEPTSNDLVLARRIMTIQLQEIREELAEIEHELALARNNFPATSTAEWEEKKKQSLEAMLSMEEKLNSMMLPSSSSPSKRFLSMVETILDQIANFTTKNGENAAPYRGATGYAPMLDTRDDIDAGVLPFTSPYSLMREILKDQCETRVIGAIIENTNLLNDNFFSLGGAIILQRIPAKKKVTIESLGDFSYDDENEDYGNEIKGGETIVVECDIDEAVGMALSCKVPIQIESEIWERASFSAKQTTNNNKSTNSGVYDTLNQWEPAEEKSILFEEEQSDEFASNDISKIRIPKFSSSLYDTMMEPRTEKSSSSRSLFPTDISPIQNLEEYDSLDIPQKAQILMSLDNFDGRLPRPRVVRNNKNSTFVGGDALDELLLPRIDETVRNQFLMRDAKIRKDYDTLNNLKSKPKSKRQQAKEQAEKARKRGDFESAILWENQAEFYKSLRADFTQDEGSYDTLMDKDEWYERDRLARVAKIDKKQFGTLLDGIE